MFFCLSNVKIFLLAVLLSFLHYGSPQAQTAARLVDRGVDLVDQERDNAAEKVLTQGLNLAIRHNDHYEQARALLWLSECAFLRRDYEGTRRLNEEARKVANEYLFTDTIPFYFTILQNLGVSNSYLGRLDLQRFYYRAALDFQQKNFAQDAEMRADAFSNLSAAYYRTFMLDSALFWFDSTLTIATEDKMPRLRSIVLLNKGKIHAYLSDYDKAIRHQEEALRLSSTVNDRILGFSHLSDYFQEAGYPEQALRHLDSARALVRQENKSDQQYYSMVELKACQLYQAIGDTSRFRATLRALLIYLAPKGENFLADRTRAVQLFAEDLLQQGKPQQARQQAELTLAYTSRQEHPELIVQSYQLIAEALARQGQFRQSLNWIQQGLVFTTPDFESLDTRLNPSVVNIQTLEYGLPLLEAKVRYCRQWFEHDQNSAQLLVAANAQLTADSLLLLARRGMRTDMSRRILSEQLKSFQRESMLLFYRLYSSQKDSKWLEAAFHFSERSRSLLIAENLTSQAAMRSIIPAAWQQKEQSLSERLQYLRLKLAQPGYEQERKEWQQALFETSQEWENLLAELEDRFPRYHQLKYELPFATLQDVREQVLSDAEFMLSFTDLDNQVLCIGISRDTSFFQLLTMPGQLPDLVDSLRRKLLSRSADYYAQAHRLYQALLAPTAAFWKGKQLVLVPDGQLWYVPFNALPTRAGGDWANQQAFLIENVGIRWLYAAHRGLPATQSYPYKINWLGIAPFGQAINDQGDQAPFLSQLPGSLVEVERIASLLPHLSTKTTTNSRATKAFFRNEASWAQVLHLSTHALSNEMEPLLSTMYFRSSNNPFKQTEPLYAAELATMTIPAELVVLSACETQSGQLQGGEGIAGWAQCFSLAGVHGLLASSWSVNDAASPELMHNFYQALREGTNKASAYTMAQRSYLQTSDALTLHPFYWAGFIYIGDNEALNWEKLGKTKSWWSPASGLFFLLLLFLLFLAAKLYAVFRQ